jgi:hypothetical protein
MRLKEAEAVAEGLSNPSKMPGYGYSLPAAACKVGSILRKRKGTVCSKCYAMKGRYVFAKVAECLKRRLASLKHPRWVECMVFMIKFRQKQGHRYFRWHDSGDIQGRRHLKNIFEVCRQTPGVRHWLPTKEYKIVVAVLEQEEKPRNLVIRLSGHNLNEIPDTGMPVSSAHTSEDKVPGAKICQAVKYSRPCGRCRACWNPDIKHVSYGEH